MINFSIVTAVHNTAPYLDECIESVIEQTVGIDRIQMVLVDDASTDDSLSLCKKWQQRYPNNILIVSLRTNQGVSAARNAGIKLVKGRYVSFLDSDDKFTPNVCEKVELFFQHFQDVDVVALPIIFFDGETGMHPLNNKFKDGTRVINLDKDWFYTQNFISSTFVKADILPNFQFDTRMPLSEDLKFVQQIILRTHHLGVISDTEYLYRRRSGGQQSAIQSKNKNKVWYIPTLQNGLMELFATSKKRDGKVAKYLQFLAMYELQWRLKMKNVECDTMSNAECHQYYNLIQDLLRDIDDDVIMIQQQISADTKAYAKLIKRDLPIGLLNLLRNTKLLKIVKLFV